MQVLLLCMLGKLNLQTSCTQKLKTRIPVAQLTKYFVLEESLFPFLWQIHMTDFKHYLSQGDKKIYIVGCYIIDIFFIFIIATRSLNEIILLRNIIILRTA